MADIIRRDINETADQLGKLYSKLKANFNKVEDREALKYTYEALVSALVDSHLGRDIYIMYEFKENE